MQPRNFGAQLRMWREARGLTKEYVAQQVNLTEETVKFIEQGIKPIPPQLIPTWSELFGIHPQIFIVTMLNIETRKICLGAGLPYLFKIVPLTPEEEEQVFNG